MPHHRCNRLVSGAGQSLEDVLNKEDLLTLSSNELDAQVTAGALYRPPVSLISGGCASTTRCVWRPSRRIRPQRISARCARATG